MERIAAIALFGCLTVVGTAACSEILGIGDPTLPPATSTGAAGAGAAGGNGGTGASGGEAGAGGEAGGPPSCEACSGDIVWSASFGDTGRSVARALLVDAQGDVVIAGDADGSIDFGDGPTSANGDGSSVVVSKRDGDGALVWSKRFTGAHSERVRMMAVDDNGDVVLCGYFDDSVDFDGTVHASPDAYDDDVFVAKLNGSDGSVQWLNAYGDTGNQSAQGVAVDATGNIAVIGHFENAISFDASASYTSAGDTDVFLLTLDAAGGYLTSSVYGTSVNEWGRRVAYAGTDLIFAGEYAGVLSVGSESFLDGSFRDIFVARVSPTASLWGVQLGGNNDQHVRGLAVGDDHIALTGGFESNLVYEGGQSITALYPSQQHTVVLDGSGGLSFMGAFGQVATTDDNERVIVPAVDSSGHIVLTGWLEGSGSFGGDTFQSVEASPGQASKDVFVAKIAADGTHFWSHAFGAEGDDSATAIDTDGANAVLIAGSYDTSIELALSHACAATRCMFVAKLSR